MYERKTGDCVHVREQKMYKEAKDREDVSAWRMSE